MNPLDATETHSRDKAWNSDSPYASHVSLSCPLEVRPVDKIVTLAPNAIERQSLPASVPVTIYMNGDALAERAIAVPVIHGNLPSSLHFVAKIKIRLPEEHINHGIIEEARMIARHVGGNCLYIRQDPGIEAEWFTFFVGSTL